MNHGLTTEKTSLREPSSASREANPCSVRLFSAAPLGLALAAITLLIYLPVRHYGFVLFDDADYVSDNRMVRAGLSRAGIKWAFMTTDAANWHPLTWLSHMLDTQCFGAGAHGPHLMNVLLHAMNVLLLFAVLREFTGALWRSALVAALFAWHPLHVESVAWISERKDVLSGFFFLLTLLAYGKCIAASRLRSSKSKLWYAAALSCFAFGLMSKPMLVTLPFVLLLLDFWPLKRITNDALRMTIWPVIREKIPFFALSIASSATCLIAQRKGGAVRSLENFSVGERIANAFVACAQYVGKTFWPADLAVYYPHPGHRPAVAVAVAVALFLGLSFLALRLARKCPFVIVGWFWFCGMLVPTIGLIQVGNQSMADRYTYLPSIGLFVALAWGAEFLVSHCEFPRAGDSSRNPKSEIRNPKFSAAIAGSVGILAAIACIAATENQLHYWQNAETLSRRAIAVTKNNFVAHNALGSALLEQGRADEAIGEFRETLAIEPRFADAHCNLGNALLQKGRIDEALVQYRAAIESKPDHLLAHYNLGTLLLQQGSSGGAIAEFQKALEIQPGYTLAHLNLGNALLQQNRANEAIGHYREVLKLQPDSADAHNNLGSALLRVGHVSEAVTQFQSALAIQPTHANAHNNLGDVFLHDGRREDAIFHYRKVLETQPDDPDARKNLETALEMKQQAVTDERK
jgi:tetratricopeptide (TPR) repeat protein